MPSPALLLDSHQKCGVVVKHTLLCPFFSTKTMSQQQPLTATAGLCSPKAEHTTQQALTYISVNLELLVQKRMYARSSAADLSPPFSSWFYVDFLYCYQWARSVLKLFHHFPSMRGRLLYQSPLLPQDGSRCLGTAGGFTCFVLKKGKKKRTCLKLFFLSNNLPSS